jgi:carbamoyl-phosphate synthase large subunit
MRSPIKLVKVVIGGIMEHIEEAGIHSGDSACAIPTFSLAPQTLETIRDGRSNWRKS